MFDRFHWHVVIFDRHVVDIEDLGTTREACDHGHLQCQAMHD